MQIITVGLNHKTSAVEEREKLAFSSKELPFALRDLVELPVLQEGVILSTCNRVEIYGLVSDASGGTNCLKSFLCRKAPESLIELDPKLYTYREIESVTHLFNVATGLDSMVLGEHEILGQVKNAYQEAIRAQSIGKVMHVLFQKSLQTAKDIRAKTGIARGALSVGSVALSLAKRIFGELRNRKVMVVGAGEMSQLTVRTLQSAGIQSMLVSNRHYERAISLATEFNAVAIRFDEIPTYMPEVDIVISSTAAPHYVISKETVAEVMKERKQRPLFFLDIAVPRDVDPMVNQLDNVYLYDIDDLQGIANENLQSRHSQLEKCHLLIRQKAERFMTWFQQLH